MQRDVLIGQERGVRRQQAVLQAEGDQLVHQLLVLSVHVDLVDEVADAADGPEPFDEVVAAAPIGARQLGGELEASAARRRPGP